MGPIYPKRSWSFPDNPQCWLLEYHSGIRILHPMSKTSLIKWKIRTANLSEILARHKVFHGWLKQVVTSPQGKRFTLWGKHLILKFSLHIPSPNVHWIRRESMCRASLRWNSTQCRTFYWCSHLPNGVLYSAQLIQSYGVQLHCQTAGSIIPNCHESAFWSAALP